MAFVQSRPVSVVHPSTRASSLSRVGHVVRAPPARRARVAPLTATAAPAPAPSPGPRSITRTARRLLLPSLALAALNLLLPAATRLATRMALSLLLAALALVAWWQRSVSTATNTTSTSAASQATPPRTDRNQLTLPFRDRKFWDFIVFPKTYFARTFTPKDIVVLSVFVFLHAVALLAPFTYSHTALALFLAMHILTGMVGITFSYHRQLTHRAFATPKIIEYAASWIGCLALQGDPIEWVSAHRHHHKECDTEADPHSPYDGFFWSHMGWMYDELGTPTLRDTSNAADLWRQKWYVFLRKTYPLHPAAVAVAFYVWGGLPFLVWGVALRTVSMWHTTWLVNSASHVWGFQSWKTNDLSMNNWWVGLLAFGEGWHNNHHAFEDSARHGLEWWQVDVTWYLIATLRFLGLAKQVRLPSERKMKALKVDEEKIVPVSWTGAKTT